MARNFNYYLIFTEIEKALESSFKLKSRQEQTNVISSLKERIQSAYVSEQIDLESFWLLTENVENGLINLGFERKSKLTTESFKQKSESAVAGLEDAQSSLNQTLKLSNDNFDDMVAMLPISNPRKP